MAISFGVGVMMGAFWGGGWGWGCGWGGNNNITINNNNNFNRNSNIGGGNRPSIQLLAGAIAATLATLVVLAALAGEIACPPCRLGAATSGNTIPSIAAALPTKTGQQQIASVERRVAILSPDFGPTTLEEFQKMERFNPDKSWTPVTEEDE